MTTFSELAIGQSFQFREKNSDDLIYRKTAQDRCRRDGTLATQWYVVFDKQVEPINPVCR